MFRWFCLPSTIAAPSTLGHATADEGLCAGAWRAVLTEERPGELWFDGLAARATRSVAVEEKGMRLFLLDQPEAGLPRGWKRKQPRINS